MSELRICGRGSCHFIYNQRHPFIKVISSDKTYAGKNQFVFCRSEADPNPTPPDMQRYSVHINPAGLKPK